MAASLLGRDLRSIAVFMLRHIGDTLLSTPTFHALRAAFPSARILAVVNEGTQEMLEGNPDIDDILVFRRRRRDEGGFGRWKEEAALVRSLRAFRAGLSVNLTEGDRGAILSVLSGARHRVGVTPNRKGFLGKEVLFTHLCGPHDRYRHAVLRDLDVVAAAGIPPADLRLRLPISDEDREKSARILREAGIAAGHPFAVVQPTSRWTFKCWTEDGMAGVISHLADRGFAPVVTSGPAPVEVAQAERIRERAGGRAVSLAGRLSLKELGGVIAIGAPVRRRRLGADARLGRGRHADGRALRTDRGVQLGAVGRDRLGVLRSEEGGYPVRRAPRGRPGGVGLRALREGRVRGDEAEPLHGGDLPRSGHGGRRPRPGRRGGTDDRARVVKWSIVHTEWSDGFGGQEHRILLECGEMIRRGHRAAVVCRPEAEIRHKAGEAGVPVHPMPIRSSFDPAAVAGMIRLFRREKVDVVNTHSGKDSWVGSIAAKVAGVPLLLRTRHISVPVRRGWYNLIYRWPDGYVTTGEMIREHLIGVGISPDRVVSIPTGVDVDRFSPDVPGAAVRAEFGIGRGEPLVSVIGVLRSWKRHDVFLEAVRLLRERGSPVRGLVVGEGPQRERIAGEIAGKDLARAVRMTGYRRDIPEIVAASDVIVLPSDRFEGVPQVILQSLAMGRAVVASPIGGIPEVVHHEKTGLLCPVGDPSAFADAIARLLAEPELRERLGATGRELVLSRYSSTAMCERTEGFYEVLASAKKVQRSRKSP